MNNAKTEGIKVVLHQQRNYETGAVEYEEATVTKTIKERSFSVEVYARTSGVGGKLKGYEINWAAIGSSPIHYAVAYAELLNEAAKVAERLTKAYVK